MSIELLYYLKRERDISINPMLSGGKTTFMCTPALKRTSQKKLRRNRLQSQRHQYIGDSKTSAGIINENSNFIKF